MKSNEVYNLLVSLSHSQGFYGRLLARLSEVSEEIKNEFLDSFSDCKDSLDVIMKIEG